MKKLTSSLILFTRTLVNDYRWIFWDEKLQEEDRRLLRNDVAIFERKKEEYLEHKHLFVRKLANGIALYRFFDTERYDSSMRKIYALSGIVFFQDQYVNLLNILSSVIADCFLSFECYNEILPESNIMQNEVSAYPVAMLFKKLFEDEQPEIIRLKNELDKFFMLSDNTTGFMIVEADEKIDIKEFENKCEIKDNVVQGKNTVVQSQKKTKCRKKETMPFSLLSKFHLRNHTKG